jgi:hypothetical protein
MNMQTIEIMILLLDGFIKLAPWRSVMEAIGRIVDREGKSLLSFSRATAVLAGLCVIAAASIFRPASMAGYFVGVIPPHVSRGSLVVSYLVSGFYLGAMLRRGWGLRNRGTRQLFG